MIDFALKKLPAEFIEIINEFENFLIAERIKSQKA